MKQAKTLKNSVYKTQCIICNEMKWIIPYWNVVFVVSAVQNIKMHTVGKM
jgi:hypothetical protein